MENIKLNFVIICDNAIIAEDNKSLYILGVFDTIFADRFPARHPRFSIVVNVSGDPGEYPIIIKIKHKDTQEKIVELPTKLYISGTGRKAQFIGTFLNIQFKNEGEYVGEVFINDKLQDLTTNFFVKQKGNN